AGRGSATTPSAGRTGRTRCPARCPTPGARPGVRRPSRRWSIRSRAVLGSAGPRRLGGRSGGRADGGAGRQGGRAAGPAPHSGYGGRDPRRQGPWSRIRGPRTGARRDAARWVAGAVRVARPKIWGRPLPGARPGHPGRPPDPPERTCVQHDDVDSLRRSSAAWRLLRADTAPLVLSFLGTLFVEENVRAIPESDLVARLDDHLWAVDGRAARSAGTEPRYPRAPQAYVDHWAHPDQGWLRAWYPPGSAEPHYDATPAVEQAVRWVASLRGRGFVGTESRLNTVFELLRQLAVGTQTDPAERLRELEERRAAIDEEIAQVRAGRVAVLDAAAQRDRYQQLTQTAADLLSDFREVEANFRALDRELRE